MNKLGSTLVTAIVFGSIVLMGIGAIISLLITEQRAGRITQASETAFQIAEAGLNQYRWRLTHNPTDYTGLTNQAFFDNNGNLLGYITVTITPPTAGSSIITITSIGSAELYPSQTRTIQARYGKPSYAEFAFVTNNNVWFGENEAVHGKLHSNGGIRMDGTGDSLITTIKETYYCGQEHGCDDTTSNPNPYPNLEENWRPGVWSIDPNHTDDLWQFPIADKVDFDVVTLKLEDMQTAANDDGILLPDSNTLVANTFGYHIIFNSTGTFTVKVVTKLQNKVNGYDTSGSLINESNDIKNETALTDAYGSPIYQNHALPNNGIIFVEDQTWVTGDVHGRVTVAAANLAEGSTTTYDIIIPSDIKYYPYPDRSGDNVLGLIAQQDILVPYYSDTDLIIDAALMAQKGHVYRYLYYGNTKNSIVTYGTIITNDIWTWTWVDRDGNVSSGYNTTNTIYDSNLIYAPPPFFPTKDEYTFISWEEL
ncbi:MAG: hypothetical protein WCW27_02890 [Patescibacteria group bacterium]|jgi:hypothetical protein